MNAKKGKDDDDENNNMVSVVRVATRKRCMDVCMNDGMTDTAGNTVKRLSIQGSNRQRSDAQQGREAHLRAALGSLLHSKSHLLTHGGNDGDE